MSAHWCIEGCAVIRFWVSDDGIDWTAVDPRGLGSGQLWLIGSGVSQFLGAVGTAGQSWNAVISTDGMHGSHIGQWPGPVDALPLAAQSEAGYVVAVENVDAGFPIWTSADGGTWVERLQPPDGWELDALAADGKDVVTLGSNVDGDHVPVVALVSSDGGLTWDPSAGWPAMSGGCVESVAIKSGVAVAVGGCWDLAPEDVAGWRAELP
jgi:hypothetical protein